METRDSLLRKLGALATYAKHRPRCNRVLNPDDDCTCGLDDLLVGRMLPEVGRVTAADGKGEEQA